MNPTNLIDHPKCQLLDVRLPDDYEAAHLAGAQNNCVFEVAFVERLKETAPDASQLTIVYGENSQSGEAQAAMEKLRRQGYSHVKILDGGLEGAKAASLEIIEGTPVLPQTFPSDGTHKIDLAESRVEWMGRNLLNKHWGTAVLVSGHLDIASSTIIGGEFVIDLTQLECTDLAGTTMHDVLISHLHNDDFFDVENHPLATFVITKASSTEETSPGSGNLKITGDLSLRGQTCPIEFTASAGITEEGKAAAQASFSIDRTRWGILYGSGKFFHRLAGHLVNDHLEFQLRIITK